MTYNERIRAIAEEMAKGYRPRNWPLYNQRAKDEYINMQLPAARIAVKHMANAAEDAYLAVEDGHCMGAGTYVREQGLIPDQEAGKDE
jgi:hypothetical protein